MTSMPPIEDDTPSERELRLAIALAEFVDGRTLGETLSIEAFCAAHRDLHPELQDQLQALEMIANDPAEDPLPRPLTLSGHKILDEIGSGGMGRVFLANDERLGRKVAIKTLKAGYLNDSQLRARFMQEARSMARLNHPNIVRIYNLGQPDEMPHFVMEYIEGVSLEQACLPLTLRQKIEMLHKVVTAVDFFHQNGVIHRDLKPANILVGHDLQPKLLDFGLALRADERDRQTLTGVLLGTPRYFSPEQAKADSPLDARSDVFSLGTILYELLTGVVPFRGGTPEEDIRLLCNNDPVLPRRVNPAVPGELQNICLKALEKKPADRYHSAREMAEDLERYLAGEQTLAEPTAYTRLMSGKIAQHLRELEGWKQDEIVSDSEYRALRKGYNSLIERDDAWIMQARRLTMTQVILYLGAWFSVLGAALVFNKYSHLCGTLKVAVAIGATIPMGFLGIRCWRQGLLRVGIAYLLAFCVLLPISLVVTFSECNLFSAVVNSDWELFRQDVLSSTFQPITNNQMWWSLLLSLPAYLQLRRFTRSSVFSLVFAIATTLFCLVQLMQMGMLTWDTGKVCSHLIPAAVVFFAMAMIIEKLKYPSDSRYFYPIATAFTWLALTGLAYNNYGFLNLDTLQRYAPWKLQDRVEYLFIVNAGIYFILQAICERLPWEQLKNVARAFRFVVPSHILIAIWSLGSFAMSRWDKSPLESSFRVEARIFEVLLPCVACVFVFRSVPRQMKNFFVWGMVFLAVGIVNLQQDIFKDRRSWLISLIACGLILMLTATNYATLRMTVSRWLRRTR